jgi:hypothetical protein
VAWVETNRLDARACLELPRSLLEKNLSEVRAMGRQGDIHKTITVDIVRKYREGRGVERKISYRRRSPTLLESAFGDWRITVAATEKEGAK